MREILQAATVWGLLAGVIEGLLYWSFVSWNILSWEQSLISAGPEQMWVSSIVNGLLFPVAVLPIAILSKAFPKYRWQAAWVFVLMTLTAYALFHMSGRMHRAGSLALAIGLAFQVARWIGTSSGLIKGFRRALPIAIALPMMLLVGVESWRFIVERRQTQALPETAPDTPNILLIVLDTARADYISAKTPHLERLSKDSIAFQRAYATSSWTPPSHASLFTGRWAFEHGVTGRGNWQPLDGRYPTLAEVLQANGYRTGGFSANTLWTSPRTGLNRGFIRYSSLYETVADCFSRSFYGRLTYRTVLPKLGLPSNRPTRLSPEINDEFLFWLGNGGKRPFFAFLNYMDLHDPHYTLRRLGTDMERSEIGGPRERRIAEYEEAFAILDKYLAELFKRLDQDGWLTNTIVVVTSDHGELLGEFGLDGHGNALHHPLVHVPLLIRMPEAEAKQAAPPHVVSLADLPATILEMAGIPQGSIPGISLEGLWQQGSTSRQPRPAFAEIDGAEFERAPEGWPIRRGWQRSIVWGDWQLTWGRTGDSQLFSVVPGTALESNLWDSPESSAIVRGIVQEAAKTLPRAVLPEFPQRKEP